MLKLNIIVVVAMLTLAVALVACGQGVELTPEPTPTLIPMMSVDEVSRIVGECTGLVHNDLAKIDVEKMNSLSEAVGLQPVQPTDEGFDEHLVVLGYAAYRSMSSRPAGGCKSTVWSILTDIGDSNDDNENQTRLHPQRTERGGRTDGVGV